MHLHGLTLDEFQELNEQFKQRQKPDYDCRNRTHPLPPIPNDTEVWVTSGASPGIVTAHSSAPILYIVDTPQEEIVHCGYPTGGNEKNTSQCSTQWTVICEYFK